jgi:hypothetical protein
MAYDRVFSKPIACYVFSANMKGIWAAIQFLHKRVDSLASLTIETEKQLALWEGAITFPCP